MLEAGILTYVTFNAFPFFRTVAIVLKAFCNAYSCGNSFGFSPNSLL